ncbi:MAG: excinuclease ABC subunit UvrC [Vampirovibrionales bacterium]|nr:excinuclease ABC subunit UvrC [Vampirovibrionales bacterium]
MERSRDQQPPDPSTCQSVRGFNLQSELQRLPDKPGVYLMYDASGVLIYVGKAKVLKNRVRQYFQHKSAQHTPKVQAMVDQVSRFDYIVTDSEVEALILETTLIKKHLPKFNILARDDKRYPWIGISGDAFPRVFITRDPGKRYRRATSEKAENGSSPEGKKRRGPQFFGPYTSSRDMYHLLDVIKKHFPLRQRPRPLFKDRPCMNFYIGTCPGPCQSLVTHEAYDDTLKQVELFLKGRSDDLLETLDAQMKAASDTMNFELAAKLRDRYLAVENLIDTQKVFYSDPSINYDIISACGDDLRCAFNILSIRKGKLIASRSHEILLTQHELIREAYSTFVYDYYDGVETDDLPDSLILQYPLEDEDVFFSWLNQKRRNTKRAGQKSLKTITGIHPEKGDKKELLEMSFQNARETLEKAKLYDASRLKNDPMRALMSLQEVLDLPVFPQRMECYDISHFQGGQTVASMVVFTNGVPDKAEYRRFKIQSAEGKPDDFKSMYEVIKRRIRHLSKKLPSSTQAEVEGADQDKTGWPDPDLMIIDGGKGQLGAAVNALRDAGIYTQNALQEASVNKLSESRQQPIISLAKKFEEVFVPYQPRPILIDRAAPALFLLQQIRDEAHRFAITYHRKLRSKAATVSALDNIPGVGPKTKTILLKHFGSANALERASLESLQNVPGLPKPLAEKIYRTLQPNEDTSD